MTNGCIIFAHNSQIDYGTLSILSASLVHKNLDIPVSLISDKDTIEAISNKDLPFDHIIEVPKPLSTNRRRLLDGSNNIVDFINSNRSSVYDLTPYDQTLVIDSDFLVFSDVLKKYFETEHDFQITAGMLNLQETRIAPTDYKVGEFTINMLWATNFIFRKTDTSKIFFDLIDHIKDNYTYYARLFNFDSRLYRNDYAFSVAAHIMSAQGLDKWYGDLPSPLMFKFDDKIVGVKENNHLTFLCEDFKQLRNYLLVQTMNQDIHVLNKQTLLDNIDELFNLTK